MKPGGERGGGGIYKGCGGAGGIGLNGPNVSAGK